MAESGVAGAIIPDLPLEELGPWAEAADEAGVATVLLVAPSTPADRIAAICRRSRGFVYAVGRMGVTGEQAELADSARAGGRPGRPGATELPVCVGIGVSTPEQAADGVRGGRRGGGRLGAGAPAARGRGTRGRRRRSSPRCARPSTPLTSHESATVSRGPPSPTDCRPRSPRPPAPTASVAGSADRQARAAGQPDAVSPDRPDRAGSTGRRPGGRSPAGSRSVPSRRRISSRRSCRSRKVMASVSSVKPMAAR